MAVAFSFKQTPDAARAYLQNKGYKLTFNYDEMKGTAHHKAFTVAKVTRVDLLNDIFESLNQALASGATFADWQTNIKPTLQAKGWWGKKEVVNPATGEIKDIYIGSRRLRTIFNTNMRVAYAVARHAQMSALTTAIYWRYRSMLLPNSRDGHKAIHGITLHKDDPFWRTNYPPNAWNCKCKVQALSQKQLDKRGIKLANQAPQNVASPDWAHDVGAGSKVGALTQMNLGNGLALIPANKALDNLDDAQIKDRFYNTLGIKKGDHYIDKIGDPMVIDDELFTSSTSSKSKLNRDKRKLYIDELAKTISAPDEIYLEVEPLKENKTRLLKKMFRYFKNEAGKQKAFVAMFEYQQDKTIGVTAYVIDNAAQTEKRRIEKLIYKK